MLRTAIVAIFVALGASSQTPAPAVAYAKVAQPVSKAAAEYSAEARIAELEDESRALASVTEEVEGRLDGAIVEIRAALGR